MAASRVNRLMSITVTCCAMLSLSGSPLVGGTPAPEDAAAVLGPRFAETVRPFLQQYCVKCHGADSPEADLNLDSYSTMALAAKDSAHWSTILDRLQSGQMPPKKAKTRPSDNSRRLVVEWFHIARDDDAHRHAGDPGIVLARRLSTSEFDYSIRDLAGVDIQPTREFPAEPANTAGFDNSGETLVMSSTLLNKYLQAAHEVANHMFLTPDGIDFCFNVDAGRDGPRSVLRAADHRFEPPPDHPRRLSKSR